MERIPTQEDTCPLAQPRRRVAEAYATNDRHKDNKAKTNTIAKNLRNKAETMPELEVRKVQNIVKKIDYDEPYDVDVTHQIPVKDKEDSSYPVKNGIKNQKDLEEEVENMFNYLDKAEEDEIDTNNSMLSSAVKAMDDSIKFYLGKVFGYGEDLDDDDNDDIVKDDVEDIDLSEEQLDAIAKKISQRLEREAKLEFKTKADSVKQQKVKEVKQVLAEDKMNTLAMASDVHEVKNVVIEDLKDEIDVAAARVKDSLSEKVKNLRNEVVMEITGKKLDDIEKVKQAKKEKKQEIVKRFEEIQQQTKIQVAKGEASVNNTTQVDKKEEPIGKIAQVTKAAVPIVKTARVAKVEAPVMNSTQVAKLVGTSVENNAQVAKVGDVAPVGKKNTIQLKNIKTLNSMNVSIVSDAISNVQTVSVKTEANNIDRDDSNIKIALGTEESDDTETTSTSSTSYKPDYESALRDATDDDEDD